MMKTAWMVATVVAVGMMGGRTAEADVLAVRSVLVTTNGGDQDVAHVGICERGGIRGGLWVYKDILGLGYAYRGPVGGIWPERLQVPVGNAATVLLQVRPGGGGLRWSVTVNGVLVVSGVDPEARQYDRVWLAAKGNAGHAETTVETDTGLVTYLWNGAGELAGWGTLAGRADVVAGYLCGARDDGKGARMIVVRKY